MTDGGSTPYAVRGDKSKNVVIAQEGNAVGIIMFSDSQTETLKTK